MKDSIFHKFIIFDLKSILGIFLSVLCVWWAFKDFELSSFLSILLEIKISYLLLATFLLWISVWLRSFRWQYLFQPDKIPNIFLLYRSEMIGHFGNNILPLRLGELFRVYIINKDLQISKSYVFGTIVLERLLDLVSFLFFSIILIIISPYGHYLSKNFLWLVFFISIFIMFIFLISKFIGGMENKIWFLNNLEQIVLGVKSIRFEAIFPIILLSIMIWFIYLINIYLLQLAFDFNLDFIKILMVLVFSFMAIGVPAAPGMVGTYHAAVKFAVVDLLGFSSVQGSAFALVSHAYGYILLTLIGLYYFIKNQFASGLISRIVRER